MTQWSPPAKKKKHLSEIPRKGNRSEYDAHLHRSSVDTQADTRTYQCKACNRIPFRPLYHIIAIPIGKEQYGIHYPDKKQIMYVSVWVWECFWRYPEWIESNRVESSLCIETKYRLRFHFNEILIASVIISAFTFHSASTSLFQIQIIPIFGEMLAHFFPSHPPIWINGRLFWCEVTVFFFVNCEYVEGATEKKVRKQNRLHTAKQMKCVTERRTIEGRTY